MYTKTITYSDYNGEERTETFMFNLTRTELAQMEFKANGGLKERLEEIVKSKNVKELGAYFTDLILLSYGEKSQDGRRFMKSEEISKAFSETPAYDEFFIELLTNTNTAADFVNGITPQESIAKISSKVIELQR